MVDRQRLVRRLAARLSEHTAVTITVDYDRSSKRWQLQWTDGPTVDSLRGQATVEAETLGLDPGMLDYRRFSSDLGQVAAAVLRLRTHPEEAASLRYRLDSVHAETGYPEHSGHDVLAQARHALAATDPVSPPRAVAGLAERGSAALATDTWLATTHQPSGDKQSLPYVQRKEQPLTQPPTLAAEQLDPRVRARLSAAITGLVTELTGPATGTEPDDTLRGLWAGEQARQLIADVLDTHQQHQAARARAEGTGLGTLSRSLGLNRSTLRKRWPDLAEQERPLRWLHEHAEAWRTAITALAERLEASSRLPLERTYRDQLRFLVGRTHGTSWHSLIDTPEAARTLLPGLHRHPDGIEAELDWLESLLADYETTVDSATTDGYRQRGM